MSTPADEQYVLFDCGLNLSRLRETQEKYMQCIKAPNTRKGYAHSWGVFEKWCAQVGRPALPTTPPVVCLFVTWALDEYGYRLGSVSHALSAITNRHQTEGFPSPIDTSVRQLVTAARRALQEEPGGKLALTPEQLIRCCQAMDPTDRVHIRDRAILLLTFNSGWRRAEISGLNLTDLEFVKTGLRLRLRKSKTDQEAKGRVIGVPFVDPSAICPVRAVRAWLDVRGGERGALFLRFSRSRVLIPARLSGQGICTVLKRALERVGIDSSAYGAHSLRAGMVTAAAEAGSSEIAIMQRTGHKSMATMLRYVRPTEAFKADPLAGVWERAASSLVPASR